MHRRTSRSRIKCVGDLSGKEIQRRRDPHIHIAVKSPSAMQETQLQSLGDPLEKEMTTHSSILVWEIPWTEKPLLCPPDLHVIWSQRAGHDLVTK